MRSISWISLLVGVLTVGTSILMFVANDKVEGLTGANREDWVQLYHQAESRSLTHEQALAGICLILDLETAEGSAEFAYRQFSNSAALVSMLCGFFLLVVATAFLRQRVPVPTLDTNCPVQRTTHHSPPITA
jgi:hypothetical protein